MAKRNSRPKKECCPHSRLPHPIAAKAGRFAPSLRSSRLSLLQKQRLCGSRTKCPYRLALDAACSKEARRKQALDDMPAEAVYMPYAQAPDDLRGQAEIKVSTSLDPAMMIPVIRDQVHALAKDLPPVQIVSVDRDLQETENRDECSLTRLLGSFGALALAASRMLGSFLFGVQGFDPVTYMMLTSVLILAAVRAAYVPARRALKVDPMLALRCE
jgi:hypothetical protein